MKTVFVDSNVFVRFLAKDDRGQGGQAADLFRSAAEGHMRLLTGPPVLFEIAWTLRAAYGKDKQTVLDVLASIASWPGLTLVDDKLVDQALALARATGQEFADAYVAVSAHEHGADAVATFNRRRFDKMGISLHEM